jgi:hypothetical protein
VAQPRGRVDPRRRGPVFGTSVGSARKGPVSAAVP